MQLTAHSERLISPNASARLRRRKVQLRMLVFVFRSSQEMDLGRDGRVNHPESASSVFP
jgi:hypothetical protein